MAAVFFLAFIVVCAVLLQIVKTIGEVRENYDTSWSDMIDKVTSKDMPATVDIPSEPIFTTCALLLVVFSIIAGCVFIVYTLAVHS